MERRAVVDPRVPYHTCRHRPPPLPPAATLPPLDAFPEQAVVRSLPNESNMTISLVVAGKQRNMDRWAGRGCRAAGT